MYKHLESVNQESTEIMNSRFSDQAIEEKLSDHLLEFQQLNLVPQDETESEEIYASTVSNDDLLLQIQVTNNLLSYCVGLLFFIFVFMIAVSIIKVIKNNITNLID